MKKLLKWIGTDGLLHIAVCACIAFVFGRFFNPGLALFAAVFCGVLKEVVWDGWMKRGTFEFKDLICDLIGAVAAFVILIIPAP